MFDSVPRASGAEEQAAEAAETEVMSLDAGSRASWLDAARQSGAVSVDTGSEAQRRADAIDARAFTLGGRIYLGAEYKRGTPEGDGLLAHELTHARQQQAGPPRLAAGVSRRIALNRGACGVPASCTLAGPPERMMALGRTGFRAASARSKGTISE